MLRKDELTNQCQDDICAAATPAPCAEPAVAVYCLDLLTQQQSALKTDGCSVFEGILLNSDMVWYMVYGGSIKDGGSVIVAAVRSTGAGLLCCISVAVAYISVPFATLLEHFVADRLHLFDSFLYFCFSFLHSRSLAETL